jgi:hypothetical protein
MRTAESSRSTSETAARVWVDANRVPAVRRSLEALSRRGKRLGTGAIELRERYGQVEVEIRGVAPMLGGYRVAATLHHEGGETVGLPAWAVRSRAGSGLGVMEPTVVTALDRA